MGQTTSKIGNPIRKTFDHAVQYAMEKFEDKTKQIMLQHFDRGCEELIANGGSCSYKEADYRVSLRNEKFHNPFNSGDSLSYENTPNITCIAEMIPDLFKQIDFPDEIDSNTWHGQFKHIFCQIFQKGFCIKGFSLVFETLKGHGVPQEMIEPLQNITQIVENECPPVDNHPQLTPQMMAISIASFAALTIIGALCLCSKPSVRVIEGDEYFSVPSTLEESTAESSADHSLERPN